MVILSTLEPLPTHIVTSPSTSLHLFCNSCFELLILAIEPVSNTLVLLWTLVKYTSITCLSHIPLFTLPSFLSAKFWDSSASSDHFLCSEAHSSRLGSSFGLLHGSNNLFAILLWSSSFFPFALFFETSDLVNHQHLMLFLDFYLRRFQHREELGNYFRYPLHIIVHHYVLVTWW